MHSRGLEIDGGCLGCDHDQESITHSFLECPKVKEIWRVSLFEEWVAESLVVTEALAMVSSHIQALKRADPGIETSVEGSRSITETHPRRRWCAPSPN